MLHIDPIEDKIRVPCEMFYSNTQRKWNTTWFKMSIDAMNMIFGLVI